MANNSEEQKDTVSNGNGNGNEKNGLKKKKPVKSYIIATLIVLIVIGVSIYWYMQYIKYVSTDDAHVDSDEVSVSSKIMGRVVSIHAVEGDSVKNGTLLVELDSADLLAQKMQTIAMRQQTVSNKIQAEAKYKYDEVNIKVLDVNLHKSEDDFKRAKDQFSADVISKEQYEHIQKSLEQSKAQIDAANSELQVARSLIGSADASIGNADAQIEVIETQLKNTKIFAPMDGVIAKRWVLPGDVVQPGQSVLTITNNRTFWVAVYLEETKMSDVHMNQRTLFTLDAYPGVSFIGRVIYIGSNTASEFSLIPPNNASGNFTKVTQRIPLKISIDSTDNNSPVSGYKFMAGMSAVVKIVK